MQRLSSKVDESAPAIAHPCYPHTRARAHTHLMKSGELLSSHRIQGLIAPLPITLPPHPRPPALTRRTRTRGHSRRVWRHSPDSPGRSCAAFVTAFTRLAAGRCGHLRGRGRGQGRGRGRGRGRERGRGGETCDASNCARACILHVYAYQYRTYALAVECILLL